MWCQIERHQFWILRQWLALRASLDCSDTWCKDASCKIVMLLSLSHSDWVQTTATRLQHASWHCRTWLYNYINICIYNSDVIFFKIAVLQQLHHRLEFCSREDVAVWVLLKGKKLHDVQKAACFLSVILTPTTVVKSLTACLSTTRTLTWMFLGNLPKVGFIVSSGCV